MHPPHRRRAFTLIELLVVISIIALIISLLLPALAGALNVARQIRCSSNYRSLGQAMGIYVEDYDGHYIQNRSRGTTTGGSGGDYRPSQTWTRIIRPYIGESEDIGAIARFDDPNPDIFTCPQMNAFAFEYDDRYWLRTSNFPIDHVSPGYNWMIGSATPSNIAAVWVQDGRVDQNVGHYGADGRLPRESDVHQPYNTVLFADFFGFQGHMAYGQIFGFDVVRPENQTFVHGGENATVVYADGSVGSLNRQEWGWGVQYPTDRNTVPQPWNPW